MAETQTLTFNYDECRAIGQILFAGVDCPCGVGRFYLNLNAPPPWVDYCRHCGRRCEATPADQANAP